jgi:cold shock CspA family protein
LAQAVLRLASPAATTTRPIMSMTSSTERFEGVLRFWKKDSGYGFIKPNDGGKDVFVHKKELIRFRAQGGTPEKGALVNYVKAFDETRGKTYAAKVCLGGGYDPWSHEENAGEVVGEAAHDLMVLVIMGQYTRSPAGYY